MGAVEGIAIRLLWFKGGESGSVEIYLPIIVLDTSDGLTAPKEEIRDKTISRS